MCRLFGFRSVMQSGVHRSLVSADNALMQQSEKHPDGWGVTYYVADSPHVIKSVDSAVADHLFQHVSGIVTSETVIAHIRKATQGRHTIVDTHPFQYGQWVFAHNGNIKDFASHRPQILQRIAPRLRNFILGETDSEAFFYLLLSKMQQRCELNRKGYPLEDLAQASREAISEIESIVGPMTPRDADPPTETFLTFLLTNGKTMIAHQGGKNLYFSTHKDHCSQRDSCPYFAPECESQRNNGFVSHLLFSSEELEGENVWQAMHHREMIGVDWRMQMTRFSADEPITMEAHRSLPVSP